MCIDEHDGAAPARQSRRSFLRKSALAGGMLLVPSMLRDLVAPAASFAAETNPWRNALGETAYRAAMHLHASFSEGRASWSQHFAEAARHGIDILVPTDHDWRMARMDAGREFHFSGWVQSAEGSPWRLAQTLATANLTLGSGGALVTPAAPADQTPGAQSLRMVARSATARRARLAYEIRRDALRGSGLGRTFQALL